MRPMPVLESERLVMRALSEDDAEALYPLYSDIEAMRWWSDAPHTSLQQTRERLAITTARADWRAWAITLKGDDTAIGTLAAHEARQGRVFEIGYSLARPFWGGGIASEAVSRLLDRLFNEEGARRVFADTDLENAASNALLTRLGFVREGVLRGHWETHIGVRDSLIWGLLAEEWTAR